MKRIIMLITVLLLSLPLVSEEILKGKVEAQGGLVLRAAESSSSKKLSVIPNGTILSFSKEGKGEAIAGKYGLWLKTEYQGKSGWVFGSFINFNYNNTHEKSEAVFLRAVNAMGDGADTIVVLVEGKEMYFNLSDNYTGINFNQLGPVDDYDEEVTSKYKNKKFTVTWYKETVYFDPGMSYHTFYYLEKMTEK